MEQIKQDIIDNHNRLFVDSIDDVFIAFGKRSPDEAVAIKDQLVALYYELTPTVLFTPRGIDRLHALFESSQILVVFFDALASYIGCAMDADELNYVRQNFLSNMAYASTTQYNPSGSGSSTLKWNRNDIVDKYNESRRYVPQPYTTIHVIVGQFLVLFSKSNIVTNS